MKLWLLRSALTGLAGIAITAGAVAGTTTYQLDKPHTEVAFKVRHIFTKVPGRFTDFSGDIHFDEKNLENSSVAVTIQAASIFTDNERRDKHLKSADFFEVEKFPTLTFKSTKVTKGDGEGFQIEGDLTIHGVTKTVVLDAEFLGQGAIAVGGNAMGNRAGFEASTRINRKDFGILWNRTLDQGGLMVGDDVDIILNVEAVLMEEKPAAASEEKTKKSD